MTDTKELLEYLKAIMFNPSNIPLEEPNLNTTNPTLYQLGEGLIYLAKSIECFKSYANELSMGNLSVEFPSKENLFCAPLKNLHANLNHLTWQAQQIAGGDYSQHIDYLGDFSVAFNQMITQLKDREELLKRYAMEKETQAEQLLGYNELLINLMNGRKEWIFVFNPDRKELLYCNKIPYLLGKNDYSNVAAQPQIQYFFKVIENAGKSVGSKEVYEPLNNCSYFVNSFHLEWRGTPGIAYIVEDITKEREDEKRLSDLAYKDTFTGIFNRRYLLENMERLLKIGATFSFCYIDINHLKMVNDTYGHAEGDKYIMSIVDLIKDGIRETDIFARIGGDEFVVLLLKCPKDQADKKMGNLYDTATQLSHSVLPYDVSFSYGIIEVPSGCDKLTADSIINSADSIMYQFKESSKQ
mgnify:FL=1|jgi:diguanylate cyclase (GGDEF)-like protein